MAPERRKQDRHPHGGSSPVLLFSSCGAGSSRYSLSAVLGDRCPAGRRVSSRGRCPLSTWKESPATSPIVLQITPRLTLLRPVVIRITQKISCTELFPTDKRRVATQRRRVAPGRIGVGRVAPSTSGRLDAGRDAFRTFVFAGFESAGFESQHGLRADRATGPRLATREQVSTAAFSNAPRARRSVGVPQVVDARVRSRPHSSHRRRETT